MASRHLFTSESVTEDILIKIADQISDAVSTPCWRREVELRRARDDGSLHRSCRGRGEITTKAIAEIPELVRSVIHDYRLPTTRQWLR